MKRRLEHSAMWETLRDFGLRKKKADEAIASMRVWQPCTRNVPLPLRPRVR